MGVYDIVMNNYGPNTIIGSLHVSVPDTLTAREVHRLTRHISQSVYDKFGVILTVGIYAVSTGDTETGRLQRAVMQYVTQHEGVMQAHAFYYYEDKQLVTIDVVPTDDVKDSNQFAHLMATDLHAQFPRYNFSIIVDHNYSE